MRIFLILVLSLAFTACTALSAVTLFGGLRGLASWAGVQSVVCVESRREELASGTVGVERRYFLSSLPADAQRL